MSEKFGLQDKLRSVIQYPNTLRTRRAAVQAEKAARREEKAQLKEIKRRKAQEESEGILVTMAVVALAQLGLMIPDLDQQFLTLLHHRSIITHSVLLPGLAYLMLSRTSIHSCYLKITFAGLFLGVGIHLGTDTTSVFTSENHGTSGYAAVWLPEPVKVSLGVFSPIWIVLSACLSFVIMAKLINRPYSAFSATLIAGLYYAYSNEGSALAAFSITVLGYASIQWVHRKVNLWVKESALTTASAVLLILFILNLPTIVSSAANAVFNSVASSTAPSGDSIGGSSTSNDAHWVKHSSGNWIQRDSNGYIKGTLSPSKGD